MKTRRVRKTVIGLVVMAVAAVLPMALADLAGMAPQASAQSDSCGYAADTGLYVFKGNDPEVRASARVSPGTSVVVDTRGTAGDEVKVVTIGNNASRVPSGAAAYCTTLNVKQIAGPPSRSRSFTAYSSAPPSDFTARQFQLSAGKWRVTYTVTVGLAETFDGKIHLYEDTYTDTIIVAPRPCAAYEDGPVISLPGADLKILAGPGAAVSTDTFIATTPTNVDDEWVLDAKLFATSPSRRRSSSGELCYTYTATPVGGTPGTEQTVETDSTAAVDVTLSPGRWKIVLNVRSTVFDGEARHLNGIATTTRDIRVTVPVSLDPANEPLPAGLRVSAQAAGYHPSWGIAQTAWSSTLTLPQNKHWLRFRLQATDRNGNQVVLAAPDGSNSLKALITTPSNRRYYLAHAAFADGDEAGFDFVQTNGVWNELSSRGTYKISFWVTDGNRAFWSNPVKLTIR